jgi:hypothetical protein
MSWNAGNGRHGEDAVEDREVGMADSSCLILDQYFPRLGAFQVQLLDDQRFLIFI